MVSTSRFFTSPVLYSIQSQFTLRTATAHPGHQRTICIVGQNSTVLFVGRHRSSQWYESIIWRWFLHWVGITLFANKSRINKYDVLLWITFHRSKLTKFSRGIVPESQKSLQLCHAKSLTNSNCVKSAVINRGHHLFPNILARRSQYACDFSVTFKLKTFMFIVQHLPQEEIRKQ